MQNLNASELKFIKQDLYTKIKDLEKLDLQSSFSLCDSINIKTNQKAKSDILQIAQELKPWRKGPFKIDELFIDTEWQSFMKFDILKPYLNIITNKIIADVGCNNGYYMFRMLEFCPQKIIGFDPSIKYRLQFEFINAFIKSQIKYELMGVEDLDKYKCKFDVIFCLGVLYHRSDPIKTLKSLKAGLNKNGVLFLDSMYIDDEREIALIPRKTYSKISNIYFIPSILGLRNWCEKAGFKEFEILATKPTKKEEQRKTEWIDSYSLENFLNPLDENFTCEGYEAPKRIYVKLRV